MVLDLLPRPLDPVRSFKLKVGLLVTGSLAMSVLVFWFLASWQWRYALLAALVAALVLTQVLAHGMTSPLREMTKAARAMSNGDYSIRVRATSRDEIGELAQAFNKMSADLDAADQNRRELIANVSHELRTPISALHAVLENIVDGVAPADPAAMRAALAQTERLGQLVRDLLDLSRIEGGATALRPAEFAVADFVHEAVRHAAPLLRNVRTIVDVRPPTLTAVADTARLHQVMANLLGNAARHSPPGGTVTVRARRDDAGLQIDVVDEGLRHRRGRPRAGVRAVHARRVDRRRHRPRVGDRSMGGPVARRRDRRRRVRAGLSDPRVHSRCCLSRRRTWRCSVTTTTTDAPVPTGPIGPRLPRLGEPGGSIWSHRVWPAMPVAGASGRMLVAILTAGAVAAAVWQITSLSIGYLLTGLAVFTAAFLAERRLPTRRESVYLFATFALLAVPALRDAPWLGVLCIMASWVTGWLVLAGGRTWTSIVLGSLVAWLLSTRVLAWTGRGLRRAGRPRDRGDAHNRPGDARRYGDRGPRVGVRRAVRRRGPGVREPRGCADPDGRGARRPGAGRHVRRRSRVRRGCRLSAAIPAALRHRRPEARHDPCGGGSGWCRSPPWMRCSSRSSRFS